MKLKIEANKNDKFILTKYNDKYLIIFPYDKNFPNFGNNYKEFRIDEWVEDDGEKKLMISFNSDEMVFDLYSLITDDDLEEDQILSKIEEMAILFQKSKSDYKKFRGDVGELLFLKYFGGKKELEDKSFDISVGDDYVEVKSYSPNSKIIHISLKQYVENTKKFAVPIYFDQNGMTIIQLADEIKIGNEEFANQIIKQYSNDEVMAALKIKPIAPFDITDQLSEKIILPKNIINAELQIIIEERGTENNG